MSGGAKPLTGFRQRAKSALLKLPPPGRGPLLRALWQGYESYRALRTRGARPEPAAVEGLAVPPPKLRTLVFGSADLDSFMEGGRAQADFLRDLLARNGAEIAELGSILDLGCGSGRILRWWRALDGPAIYGCDYNPRLAEWCQRNLPFADVRVNRLEPPLPFADVAPFDFIYAISVFTHLPEQLQGPWLAEIRASLRPGGLFAFTVSGDHYRNRLSGRDLEAYDRGELVIHFDETGGTNMCAAYHPPHYVEDVMLEGFELLEVDRAGALHLGQDAYLVRRR